MPQDIDRILEELRQRKGAADAVPSPGAREKPSVDLNALLSSINADRDGTAGEKRPVDIPAVSVPEVKEAPPEEEEKTAHVRNVQEASEPSAPEERKEPEGISGKRSEDYIDDEFKRFFTQSVIITKSPDEMNGVDVKKKKRGLFRKKYITDSLSLNINVIDENRKADRPEKEEKPAPVTPAPRRVNTRKARTPDTRDMVAANISKMTEGRKDPGTAMPTVEIDSADRPGKSRKPSVEPDTARLSSYEKLTAEADTVRLGAAVTPEQVIPEKKRVRGA